MDRDPTLPVQQQPSKKTATTEAHHSMQPTTQLTAVSAPSCTRNFVLIFSSGAMPRCHPPSDSFVFVPPCETPRRHAAVGGPYRYDRDGILAAVQLSLGAPPQGGSRHVSQRVHATPRRWLAGWLAGSFVRLIARGVLLLSCVLFCFLILF